MLRRICNAAAVISLALCLVAIIAWARSSSRTDCLSLSASDQSGVRIQAACGLLYLSNLGCNPYGGHRFWSDDINLGGDEAFRDDLAIYSLPPSVSFAGFRYANLRPVPIWFAGVPLWWLAAITAAPLVLVLVGRRLTVRSRRAGCCAFCGYDLRASTDRCPECETAVDEKRRNY